MDIGNKIISLREKKGWTQRELAKRVGLNVSVMNRIELNDRPVKDLELINIARVLDVSVDYLLGVEAKQTKASTEPELTPYQQEVLDFFNSREDLFFHDHPGDIRQALEQFEIYYEVWKRQQEKKKD